MAKKKVRKITRPLNLIKDGLDIRDYKVKRLMTQRPMPRDPETGTRFPLQVSWKHMMTSVKDQGRKGSCVGFAAAAMKECQEAKEQQKEVAAGKKDQRQGKPYDLSEQWIYHMCKRIDPWPNEEGTSIRVAMKVLNKIGAPPEKGWPYSDIEVGEPASWSHMIAQWNKIEAYYRATDWVGVMDALRYGPVVAGIPVFNNFFYADPETGLIRMPNEGDRVYGGHAICIVGYQWNDDNWEDGWFEFKNSWTDQWGLKGYGKLPMPYIEKYLWDAWVATDMNVREIKKGRIPEIEEFA